MKLNEITSSKPDYSWLIGLLFIALACLLSCCQSKKKALNIQKSETTEQSEVKKETADSLLDKSQTYYSRHENVTGDYSEVIEESADSARIDKEGTTTVYNPKRKETRTGKKQAEKKTETKQQNDLKSVSSLKLDSVGKSHAKVKSKVQAKEVKDNLTGKASAVSFLILCALLAVVYIRWHKKKVVGL